MELLGKSLETIFGFSGKKISLKSICVLGIEMVSIPFNIPFYLNSVLVKTNPICP